jgi:O-antigen/teichoic acid export membrane protein
MFQTLNILTQKILPPWLYSKLIGSWDKSGFKKYFKNTSWIFFAKLISMGVSFFTIAFVARYLGPENYGKLSYAQSFVSLFSVIAALGIDRIVFRDLIAHPEKESEILGTAFVLKAVFGVLAVITTVSAAYLLNTDPILNWLIALITLTFIFQPFSTLSHYFNAKVQSKYVAYITIMVAFLIPALKLLVIYLDKGILYFAALIAFEAFFIGLVYVFFYIHIARKNLRAWSFSREVFWNFLSRSWPLLLSSLSGYIYGRIDQVMIHHFIDSSAVGFYDIAVRLTNFLSYTPGIIIGSLIPAIINARSRSSDESHARFRALTFLTLSIAVVGAGIIFMFAPALVSLIFGSEYGQTAIILRIYVWSTIGSIGIVLIEQYFIAENSSVRFLFFSVFGMLLNVTLNFIFIPMFGIKGAASATLITMGLVIITFLVYKWFWLGNKVTK